MVEFFLNNIYLTLLLPLWTFLIIMVGRFFSVYLNKHIIYFLTLFSSSFGILVTGLTLLKLSADKIFEFEIPFIKINDLVINCGLFIDKVSLIFGLILFIVSFLVQIYSISYMKEDMKSYRFYALLNLFNFSMAGLLFSSNLFQTYLFWELIGVTSYLLIGFEYLKKEKSLASKKVFIINRIGDTALISAIISCAYFIYNYAPNKNLVTLGFSDMNIISTLVYAYASGPLFEIICIMFIISAIVKSAQFPFYTWLQDAMEAKLPVSALLHSSTLVASGVYLTIRLIPFYSLELNLLKIISIIGILTAIVCSLSAISQTNPKKVLAYSTSAQFGLIYFALGTLNLKASLFLFIAHALIKPQLFLSLPKNNNEKWDYFKFILFLVGGLSLSGLLFSGMIAKELLVLNISTTYLVLISIISFTTAFYIIRIALVRFEKQGCVKNKFFNLEILSILILLILNIIFYIYLHKTTEYKIAEPFWTAMTAWICVYILYVKNAFWKVPILYQITFNGFYLDKFYTIICLKAYECFTNYCEILNRKVFENYKIVLKFIKNLILIFGLIESKIMNGSINYIKKCFKLISLIDIKAQNGQIQRYNTYALIILTLIITILIIVYMSLFIYMKGI